MRCENCGTKVTVGKKCDDGKTYCTKCCDKLCYKEKQEKPHIQRDII